jgi:hypothetical protein
VYYSLHDFDNISDTRVKSGWTVDISKTGIGIEISAFKYSGDKKLKINMGIQFLNLDDYQSQTIGIFLMP